MQVKPRPFHTQPCPVCKGETRRETIELEYDFGDVRILLQGVPADVCRQCGEQYVPGDIGVWLGEEVERLVARIRAVADEEPAILGLSAQARVDERRLVPAERISKWVPG